MVLAVIVVNYRTPEFTLDCMRSLARQRDEFSDFKVFLVENGSKDESLKRLSSEISGAGWSSWTEILPQVENLGYARANNLAVHCALREFPTLESVLLLNNDTVVHAGCLASMVRSHAWLETRTAPSRTSAGASRGRILLRSEPQACLTHCRGFSHGLIRRTAAGTARARCVRLTGLEAHS